MRWMKWIGFLAAVTLVAACFIEWAFVSSKSITITGVNTTGTSFGKPGYLHFLFSFFFLLFNFTPRVWAKRFNLLVTALNLAWAIRNYFLITACRAGECPERHAGIYLILLASAVMIIAALFPDIKIDPEKRTNK